MNLFEQTHIFQIVRRERLGDFERVAVDLDFTLHSLPRFGAVLAVRLRLRNEGFFCECQIDTVIAGNVLNHFLAVSGIVDINHGPVQARDHRLHLERILFDGFGGAHETYKAERRVGSRPASLL
jgi:hypothetical protein